MRRCRLLTIIILIRSCRYGSRVELNATRVGLDLITEEAVAANTEIRVTVDEMRRP